MEKLEVKPIDEETKSETEPQPIKIEQTKPEQTEGETKPEPEKEEPKWFECHNCKLREIYDAKVVNTKFAPHINFVEGSYIVKDPFSPPAQKQFMILGSDCKICKNSVCQSNSCSIFYKQRYCMHCASMHKNSFPQQLHTKIKTK